MQFLITHKDLEDMEVKISHSRQEGVRQTFPGLGSLFQVQVREQKQPTRCLLIPGAVALNSTHYFTYYNILYTIYISI